MIDWTNEIICAYSRYLFSKKTLHLRYLLGFWIRLWFYPSLFHIVSKIVFNKIKTFKWRKKYSFQYFFKKRWKIWSKAQYCIHLLLLKMMYCVKSVQIRSCFWSVFSCIRTRNNSVFGQFSRSVSNSKYFGTFVM